MVVCQLCNKELKGLQGLSNHLHLSHNDFDKKLYYDTYMKQENENICLKCGKSTHFISLNKGYAKYCCTNCQVSMQGNGAKINHHEMWRIRKEHIDQYEQQNNCTHIKTLKNKYGKIGFSNAIQELNIPIIKESKMYQYIENSYIPFIENYIKKTNIDTKTDMFNHTKSNRTIKAKNDQFEIEHNCTQIYKLIEQFGQGWLSLKLPKIECTCGAHFISNEYLPVIEEYTSTYHASNLEKQIFELIQSIYSKQILHNTKRIIPPMELDIYLPDLNLAVEFNGVFWHSNEHSQNKDYHVIKSQKCQDIGIRLIHIYEFEDLEQQKQLLKDLILGIDNYPNGDFNKNNLLGTLPSAEIIYQNGRYTIYGVGKLY